MNDNDNSERTNDKQTKAWSPYRAIEWLDGNKSETVRRVGQTILGATILAACGILWSHHDFLEKLPQWAGNMFNLFFKLAQSPIQLTLWSWLIFISLPYFAVWLAVWVASKDRKIKKLESVISN